MKKDAKATSRSEDPLPNAMEIQLARLFGSGCQVPPDGVKRLELCLKEMHSYIAANVDTDELHRWMLLSGLAASDQSLENEDFWPGYAEGITRLALILLGDYPDHRKRKPGRNKDGHYNLNACRSGQWVQTPQQRFRTLMAAGRVGYPKLSVPPSDALDEFRRRHGFRPDHSVFMECIGRSSRRITHSCSVERAHFTKTTGR